MSDVPISSHSEQLTAILHKLEIEEQHVKSTYQAVLQTIPQLEQMQQQHQKLMEERTSLASDIEEKKLAIQEINSQGLQQEKDLKALEEILDQDYEDQQLQADYAIKKLTEKKQNSSITKHSYLLNKRYKNNGIHYYKKPMNMI